jgi:hypothetical protein
MHAIIIGIVAGSLSPREPARRLFTEGGGDMQFTEAVSNRAGDWPLLCNLLQEALILEIIRFVFS